MQDLSKYASDFALPGGSEQFFDTLVALLRHVSESSMSYDDLSSKIVESYAVAAESNAISAYIGVVTRMGFWSVKNGNYSLTAEGRSLIELVTIDEPQGRRRILEIKLRDYDGYDVLIDKLEEQPTSFEQLDIHLKRSLNVEWKSRNQTTYRLNWLRSLRYVQRQGNLFVLTDEGRVAYREAKVAGPRPPVTVIGPIEPLPPHKVSPLESAVLQISTDLVAASTSGGDGAAMERAAASAFKFMGFSVELIGGSGNPDVIVTAPMGDRGYRLLVETKSRANGTVSQNDVNLIALSQHRSKANADYVAVLASDYSGGNLERWAKDHTIRLLRIDELLQVLDAHAVAVIPLDRLRDLFQGGGTTDQSILSSILDDSESSAQLTTLCRDVFDAIATHQCQEALLTEHSLYHILRGASSLDAIRATVDLLQSKLVAAIGTTEKGGLHCRVSRRTLLNRLCQIKDVVGGVAGDSDACPR